MRFTLTRSATAVLLWLAALLSTAQAATPVRYTVSLANPERHVFQVTMVLDAGSSRLVDVRLPVWDALYQVRDFSQFVSEVRAGPNAQVEKIEKSAWRVTLELPEGSGPRPSTIELRYRVFANRSGPFGLQLDSQHAFINPAQLLMYTDEHRSLPAELRFTDAPSDWKAATALAEQDGAWRANSYDHLRDSPIEMSGFEESTFTAGGGNYRIVVHAAPGTYSMAELRRMVERVVTFQTALLRDVPFPRFTLLYHFREGAGGGMEHAESAAMDFSPLRSPRDLERLAGLTAHEFFHLWNVKRIRPQSLQPVDYTREQYTRGLWFSEGVTSTYSSYTLLRAGLISREQFLEEVARDIHGLEARPARLHQSLEESSLDAWLEKYGYYTGPERSISYYQKGKLAGMLLDLAIRQATENRRSLDDLLRYLNERFARAGRFFDERHDLPTAAEAVAGRPFGDLFRQLVRSAEPVPYGQFLQYAGLELQEETRTVASLGFSPYRAPGREITVDGVEAGGAAARAGVRDGDELLLVNGQPVRRSLSGIAASIAPGSKVRIKLRRNGREFEVRYPTGRATEQVTVIVPVANPTPLQQKIRDGWLSGKTE